MDRPSFREFAICAISPVVTDRLGRATAPRAAGAAFMAMREGGLALITPLTPRAGAWLREIVTADASWDGDTLAVELRYFPALADAIIGAGFSFERDAYPN